MGRHKAQCPMCVIFPPGIFWTTTYILIHIGVFNQLLGKKILKFHKSLIRPKEIFHHHICTHFSTCYEQIKTRMGQQVVPFALSKTIWYLVPP